MIITLLLLIINENFVFCAAPKVDSSLSKWELAYKKYRNTCNTSQEIEDFIKQLQDRSKLPIKHLPELAVSYVKACISPDEYRKNSIDLINAIINYGLNNEEDEKKTIINLLESEIPLDVNYSDLDSTGRTPLIYAITYEKPKIVELLLKHPDIQVNLADKLSGETPLILAARNGYKNIVELLLRHNADKSIQDKSKRTALEIVQEIAKKSDNINYKEIINLLRPSHIVK